MPRELEHLVLQSFRKPLGRRKNTPPPNQKREDRQAHGQKLITESERIVQTLQQRRDEAPQGINPKLIFKLIISDEGNINDSDLNDYGLKLLAREGNKVLVVFPDEITLSKLRNKLAQYSGIQIGNKYDKLANIEEILSLEPEDRIGPRLKKDPLGPDEVTNLDIEIWFDNAKTCLNNINELESLFHSRGLRITDRWKGNNICLIRARIDRPTLDILTNIDYIKEVERRPKPSFEMNTLIRSAIEDFEITRQTNSDNPGILIIDSGISQGHPLLGFLLLDAQAFPSSTQQSQNFGPEDATPMGHGTAVAGIAAYGDVGSCIENHAFNSKIPLFSARVTDENNEYDEDELIEHQLHDAIKYFLENYSSIKVINISLGNADNIYKDGRYQFRLASVIDNIAYENHDRNILFTISSGNFNPSEMDDEEIIQQYPDYFFASNETRIIDPGTSAIALTVGGLSNGLANSGQINFDNDVVRTVARNKYWPSPFTRVGWGIKGAVKPDLVEIAGDWKLERNRLNRHPGNQIRESGVPTTSKDFAPPEGRLFTSVAGTSFSAPKVANLAARLFSEFPNASANMIRALIANSASVPSDRPQRLKNLEPTDDENLKIYGYGLPDFERSRWSDLNDVILLDDSEIELDSFKIYELPTLPEEISMRGKKKITITLAFDPPTRHTRCDSYLGVTMEFNLYKNTNNQILTNALRFFSNKELSRLGKKRAPTQADLRIKPMQLNPSLKTVNTGTLQKRSIDVTKLNRDSNSNNSLLLAVTCSKKQWAPVNITTQPYALVVSIAHEDPEVDLYNHIRLQTRVYQRIRITQ